jgi:S-adenosyl-L-methionine hydrolase (adenosine-forming)
MARPVITFLSDFGHGDEFVGVCHGVIARRCPSARIIDIAHGVARHDVQAGALVLAAALAYVPAGVHLAVVDPGVGVQSTSPGGAFRRAVALAPAAREQLLVGPDNGLLWLAAAELGGIREAVDIGRSAERLEPVSATFHARDIFAPVAAALACGKTLAEVGEPVGIDGVARLELPPAHVRDGALCVRVVQVDAFGNLTLGATREQLAELGLDGAEELELGRARGSGASEDPVALRRARTFGEVPPGELVLYEDSRRMLALAVNQGSAAARLALGRGDEVTVRAR